MSFWNVMRISESGLSAQRLRLDTISNNIANAETTRTAEGGPYKRQDVVFNTSGQNSFQPALKVALARSESGHIAGSSNIESSNTGVQVQQIIEDDTEGQRVYDPTHADADENGYVTYPNVNLVTEMTNMMSASRSYEANLASIDVARRMALKALEIGR